MKIEHYDLLYGVNTFASIEDKVWANGNKVRVFSLKLPDYNCVISGDIEFNGLGQTSYRDISYRDIWLTESWDPSDIFCGEVWPEPEIISLVKHYLLKYTEKYPIGTSVLPLSWGQNQ